MTPEFIDKVHKFLFSSEEEMRAAGIKKELIGRIFRLRAVYTYWVAYPQLPEREVVRQIMERYQLGKSMAYEDVRLIKICLGNLNQCTQDYYRWLFLARTEEAFQMARDNNDARAFAVALNSLGKYTQLDKQQEDKPDYSAIIPQNFEITNDPTVIGYEKVEGLDAKIATTLAKYKGKIIEEKE